MSKTIDLIDKLIRKYKYKISDSNCDDNKSLISLIELVAIRASIVAPEQIEELDKLIKQVEDLDE